MLSFMTTIQPFINIASLNANFLSLIFNSKDKNYIT
jgi:hypothetical protein